MSLDLLNRTLDAAFARQSAVASLMDKATNPLSLLDNGMGSGFGYGSYGSSGPDESARQQDQFSHYRGRVYSASNVIVRRFACRPYYAAQIGVRNSARRVSRMMENGKIPPGGFPDWLGDPDRLEFLSVHPVLTALSDPNRYITAFNCSEMIAASLCITGRAYMVAIESERPGRMWDLFPIPATWMNRESISSPWEIKPPGSLKPGIKVPDDQVASFYYADPANPAGAISPLAMMARAALVDEAISKAQHEEFNNPVPKLALIAGDVMNETSFTDDPDRVSAARPVRLEPYQRRQIVTWFQQQASALRRGVPLVLDAIIRDIKVISRKPAEMAFMESAGVTAEQIFEAYGVSRILTGQLAGTNRAGGGLAEQFFVDNCLNPLIMLVSQALTKKFGPLFSVGGERLAIWMAPALHIDSELDIEYLRIGVRSYSLTRNNVRAILRKRFGGLPRLEGFDDVVIPQTMEEREPDEDMVGIGRLSVNDSGADDAGGEVDDDGGEGGDGASNSRSSHPRSSRFHLNGHASH
jgi:phage portal protein BeeE